MTLTPPTKRRREIPLRFGRLPGWAVSFTVAIVATCISVLAISNVYAQQRQHRAEEYKACVGAASARTQFIDVFSQLRDADQQTLDIVTASAANEPATPAGHAIIAAIQKSVNAYDELLTLAAKGGQVDCSTLK